jgi:hypothetical protein
MTLPLSEADEPPPVPLGATYQSAAEAVNATAVVHITSSFLIILFQLFFLFKSCKLAVILPQCTPASKREQRVSDNRKSRLCGWYATLQKRMSRMSITALK